ncbi:hypothetical protein AXA88_24945 [Salmonella enterica]|nr:hypothetical protein [Salmonella enterica]EAX3609107.1 hypothetical protein [Salmonella enterica]EGW6282679.1 hypothetical protein [Salmonella enterica]EGX3935068.1 hypothetical protein [Salmonella enterica]
MSSEKKNIWPAYVDMMTVLLMVYVLISAILGIIISSMHDSESTNNLGEKDIDSSKFEKKLDEVSPQTLKDYFILTNDSLYYDKDSLTIKFSSDDLKISEQDINKIKSYISDKSTDKGKWLVGVYLTKDENMSVGAQLREQSVIFLNVLKILSEKGIKYSEIENRNVSPENKYENIIKVKYINAEN